MDAPTLQAMLALFERLRDLGAYGSIAILAYALLKGWIVPRWVYDTLKADRDELKGERDVLLGIAKRATTGLEHVAERSHG